MPANSATHLIFFIAAIIVASILVGAFTLVIDDLSDALENRADQEQRALRSRVEIINDLSAMPYNNTSKTLEVYVKNIGSEKLYPNETIVLINGTYFNYTWKIIGGSGNWTSGLTVAYTVKQVSFEANTDHFIKVICTYDRWDKKEFKIGDLP